MMQNSTQYVPAPPISPCLADLGQGPLLPRPRERLLRPLNIASFVSPSCSDELPLIGGRQNRISLNVDSVGLLCRYVAALAVMLVADRNLLIGRIGFVE